MSYCLCRSIWNSGFFDILFVIRRITFVRSRPPVLNVTIDLFRVLKIRFPRSYTYKIDFGKLRAVVDIRGIECQKNHIKRKYVNAYLNRHMPICITCAVQTCPFRVRPSELGRETGHWQYFVDRTGLGSDACEEKGDLWPVFTKRPESVPPRFHRPFVDDSDSLPLPATGGGLMFCWPCAVHIVSDPAKWLRERTARRRRVYSLLVAVGDVIGTGQFFFLPYSIVFRNFRL